MGVLFTIPTPIPSTQPSFPNRPTSKRLSRATKRLISAFILIKVLNLDYSKTSESKITVDVAFKYFSGVDFGDQERYFAFPSVHQNIQSVLETKRIQASLFRTSTPSDNVTVQQNLMYRYVLVQQIGNQ